MRQDTTDTAVWIVGWAYDDFSATGLVIVSIHLTRESALSAANALSVKHPRTAEQVREFETYEEVTDSMYGGIVVVPFPVTTRGN